MAKIKKYQMGGAQKMKNVIDTSLLRKYNPKDDSVLNKSIPGRTPKQFEPKGPAKGYYKLRDDYAEPGAKQREAAMVKELNKKGPVKRKGGVVKKAQFGTTTSAQRKARAQSAINREQTIKSVINQADSLERSRLKGESLRRKSRAAAAIGRGPSALKNGGKKAKMGGCAKCGKSMKKK